MQISADRVSLYRQKYSLTQDSLGELLGITGKYVGMLERGVKDLDTDSSLGILFQMLEKEPPPEVGVDEDALSDDPFIHRLRPASNKQPRMIPVIGWAHAGAQFDYEEIPKDWQDTVPMPTQCRDEKAFALKLEGDSMEPRFNDGDMLVVMPTERPYSGCFVVAKFVNDGVVFRRMETLGQKIQLVPLNSRHQASEHLTKEFAWIYPVWGRWSQLWK